MSPTDPGDGSDLGERFARHVRAGGLLRDGDRVVVAFSGGLDSAVLLHLLRFCPGVPVIELVAAHFDHRMRSGSGADLDWARGVAGAWGLRFVAAVAERVPAGESEARRARYHFLDGLKVAEDARWVVTAHHADDQAETVLFRVLRGTGLRGLGGIPEQGPRGRLRPLLPFRKGELEAYARAARVPFRVDPTNREPRYARNVLRHEVLPRVEQAVAPGARGALIRLAGLAREEEEAWNSLHPRLFADVRLGSRAGGFELSREAFLELHPAVRARLVRELARRLGGELGASGTRAALEFTSSGASGGRFFLPGGLILAREYDHLVLEVGRSSGGRTAVEIVQQGEGEGGIVLAGRPYRVAWSTSGSPGGSWTAAFALERLRFPLRLRGWTPGDRIRLPYGSKKLKKLFAEARIPAADRRRIPVLADGAGEVLWVPGLARAVGRVEPGPEAEARLIIAVTESETA